MKIRQMQKSDLSNVVNLYVDANLFAKKSDILTWTKEGLKNFPQLNLVYEDKGRIEGAVSAVLLNKRTAEINDIVVTERYRHKHIGTRLMENILQALQEYEVKKVTLWVHWQNTGAIPFYYGIGFRIKKVSCTYNIFGVPNGQDIVHLEKKL